MIKRSRTAALLLVGTAAFALSGCRDETVEAQAFPDLQSCLNAAGDGSSLFSEQDCRDGFTQAQERQAETAPRYDSLQVCEEQYGEGNCGSEVQASGSGSGSIFMPLIAGYLLGNMLSNARGVGAQPMYRTADGRYTTPQGNATYSNNTGKASLNSATFAKAPVTAGKPPMTAATAKARGGFGSSSTRTGGYGSYGG